MPASFRSPYVMAGAAALAISGGAYAACTGPGAPTNTETRCLTAVPIPGNPLQSFDISFVDPRRAEMYFADRSNAGVEIIDTQHLKWKRKLGGFVGAKLNSNGTVDNNHSGPDGVASHGRWLYAGDGDSTLKVFDLNSSSNAPVQSVSTGGTTRLDEMALTSDGELLFGANNAEDPPYGTLFAANGDRSFSAVAPIIRVIIDPSIVPAGFGLSIEQPAWDPKTARFYTSVPIIANNPAGCNYGQLPGPITCDGGLAVLDPAAPTPVLGAYNAATNTGVIPLHGCGPNGATVGVHDNLLLGCTQANNPSDKITLVINAKTHNYTSVANIVGSDEVWFNAGDRRYYTGSNRQPGGAVLGVIDSTSVLIETIPQSSGSHSVAADAERNLIFVPQVGTAAVAGPGGDTTAVGTGICGNPNGCVGVYVHHVRRHHDRDDRDDRDHRDDR